MTPITKDILPSLGLTKRNYLKDHHYLEVNGHLVYFTFNKGQLTVNSSHPVKPFRYVEQLEAWYKAVTFEDLQISTF